MPKYDVFLCHTFEDKALLAEPLRQALEDVHLSVWYDGAEIRLGDSILEKMREGIQQSRHGVVLFTPAFLSSSIGKRWAEVEAFMDDQLSRGDTKLLPLVAGLGHEEYVEQMPLLRARRYELINIDPARGGASPAEFRRVAAEVASATRMRGRVDMLGRDELPHAVGTIESRIDGATREIRILGNDCKAVEGASPLLSLALARGVRVKVLCVDPQSPVATQHLSQVDPRFPTPEAFARSMIGVQDVLAHLQAKSPELFEFRLLPVAPALGLFIVDPDRGTGSVKAEIYVPKPFPAGTRPHLVLDDSSQWSSYFVEIWDNYWALARTSG